MLPFDFTLPTDTGEPLSLSSLRGRRVILYFYPKDDTPGCTQESCEFRDLFPRFALGDAVVLGISPDGVASHQRFKQKFNLPFTLIVDENHALAERLGLWVEKTMYGQKYMGVQRTTFIIGPDGAVQHVFEKVNPAGHADEVMAFLQGGAEAAQRARQAYDAAAAAAKLAAQPAVPAATTPSPAKPAAAKPAAPKPARRAPVKKVAVKSPAKRKVAKKAVKKAVKRVAKKVAKKAVKKVAKKPVRKVAKKAVRKVAKRPVRKAAKPKARKAAHKK